MNQFRIVYVFNLHGANTQLWEGAWLDVNDNNEEFLVNVFDTLAESVGIYDVEVRTGIGQ
jgi:hypothetical protein